jgi:integrase
LEVNEHRDSVSPGPGATPLAVRPGLTTDQVRTPYARSLLAPRNWQYWLRIGRARFLGYYRPRAGAGTWHVQFGYRDSRAANKTRYEQHRLGVADDLEDANGNSVLNFDQALGAARHTIAVIGQRAVRDSFAATPDRLLYCPVGPFYTVGHAVLDYLRYMLTYRKTAASVLYISNRSILPDLGTVAVADLGPDLLRDWFAGLSRVPTHRASGLPIEHPNAEDVRRRKVTANRTLSVLTSALNIAFRDGKATDDRAWRRIRPHKVQSLRLRYLSQDEARTLALACPTSFRHLVLAALYSGCREGELVRMKVDAWDESRGWLYVAPGKNGRERWVPLPNEGNRLFAGLCAKRPRTSPMFLTSDLQPWTTGLVGDHMRTARRAVRLGTDVVFHTLRHTYASYLVAEGAPLLAVMKLLGHQSLDQVIRYAHLSPDSVAETVLDHFPALFKAVPAEPPAPPKLEMNVGLARPRPTMQHLDLNLVNPAAIAAARWALGHLSKDN